MRPHNGPVRVLGIDPGLTRMGYGVLQERGGAVEALACGTLHSAPIQDTSTRLLMLFEQLRLVVLEWSPDVMACERLFFSANAKSAVPAIQASGIALLLAAQASVPVVEYTPLQVKQAVVGHGTATKHQVQYMVERLVSGFPQPDSADAADALAVAVTHLSHRKVAALQAVR